MPLFRPAENKTCVQKTQFVFVIKFYLYRISLKNKQNELFPVKIRRWNLPILTKILKITLAFKRILWEVRVRRWIICQLF
jgi:hypothetical protein